MRLELASYGVRDVRLAERTRFEDGVLLVDREELRGLLLESGAFADVGIEVVRPGDDVRLIHVMDAVEPRFKPEPGSTFPCFVGPPKTVGDGRTHRLAGMAIVSVSEPVAGESTYWREAIVDMAGPGRQATPFGSTINLVLEFKPRPEDLNANQPDAVIHNLMTGSAVAQRYNLNVRIAELKAAAYLARTTAGLEPDGLEVYDLAPADPSLPKVVYFFQVAGMHIYGHHVDGILPSLIHPNEVLDGALVTILSNTHAYHRYATFLLQNHATVKELLARHGTDLNFLAVIAYPRTPSDTDKKEMIAEYAVKLAQMLGAQGACSNFWGSGNPVMEFMFICQKAERAGIKTVQILPEGVDSPDGPGLVYAVPEAVAIVSTGRTMDEIELPAMTRVIGGQAFFADIPTAPADPLKTPYRFLLASCTSIGNGYLTAEQY